MLKNLLFIFCCTITILISNYALANELGVAVPWQITLQEAHSPLMQKFTSFHTFVTIIIIIIAVLTISLLLYTCYRFRAQNNKKASKTSHNTLIEIIWTVIPVLIILIIMFPSIKLINYMEKVPDSDMTLKVVGYQWYWGYEYPDNEDITFESRMKQDNELEEGDYRLLSVDNKVVLPVDTNIRLLLTASDVIHSWAIPALGIKTDCIPGRNNEAWVRIDKEGTYYGQCSEICGAYHGFMPIEIKAVSKEEFKEWVKIAKEKYS